MLISTQSALHEAKQVFEIWLNFSKREHGEISSAPIFVCIQLRLKNKKLPTVVMPALDLGFHVFL